MALTMYVVRRAGMQSLIVIIQTALFLRSNLNLTKNKYQFFRMRRTESTRTNTDPTFLGNSGVGIYHWPDNDRGKYLYEVQVTDIAAMCGGKNVIPHENGFMRIGYGPCGESVWTSVDPTWSPCECRTSDSSERESSFPTERIR